MNQLEMNCRNLKTDEFLRSKVAIALTNCHLAKSGLSPYKCTEEMTVNQCTRDMVSNPIAFNAYTEFSSHVDSMCFYIQSEIFQEHSEYLVNELMKQSETSVERMKEITDKAEAVSNQMVYSSQLQEQLVKEQKRLEQTLGTMNEQGKEYFAEIGRNFINMNKISDSLKESIQTINEEQKILQKEQQQFAKQQMENIQGLNDGILESLKYTKNINEIQKLVKGDVDILKEAQALMNQKVEESLNRQQELIDGQSKLSEYQQIFYEKTNLALKSLSDQSQSIDDNMIKSLKHQNDLIEQQKLSKDYLIELMSSQEEHYKRAEQSITNLLKISQETSSNLQEQHKEVSQSFLKIYSVIEKILHLYSSLIGEFMTIQTFLYYTGFVSLSYLLTSTRYTQGARIWLFATFTFEIIIEKIIIYHFFRQEFIHDILWMCRKLFILISIVLLGYTWYNFSDFSKLNNGLLMKQSQKLKRIEGLQENIMKVVEKFKASASKFNTPLEPVDRTLATKRLKTMRKESSASLRLRLYLLQKKMGNI